MYGSFEAIDDAYLNAAYTPALQTRTAIELGSRLN